MSEQSELERHKFRMQRKKPEVAALEARPAHQNVVITDRGAPARLIELADTVTDMGDVKHAFRAGIKAQPGIEL